MANTPASKKAKGKRLEREVSAHYRHIGLFSDAKPQLLSGGGYLKGDIWTKEPIEFAEECKNQERVSIWKWWDQTTAQQGIGQKPLLHISANYRPILTVLRFEDFAQMRLELKQLREERGIK
mgnify:FL=1